MKITFNRNHWLAVAILMAVAIAYGESDKAITGTNFSLTQKGIADFNPEEVEVHSGEASGYEDWSNDKIHVIYGTFVVPSNSTVSISSGAIIKFYSGASLDVISDGKCYARGVVFTHIDDDTVGGDTLDDGFKNPPMDAYIIKGDLIFNNNTEFKFITLVKELSGTTTDDQSLHHNITYIVSGTLTINGIRGLTIPGGTVIKMSPGASIVISKRSTLYANGTSEAPIIITSIKDDRYGGDTNGDGNATMPQPGDWNQVRVVGSAHCDYLNIYYGSSEENHGALEIDNGTTWFYDGTIAHAKYECFNMPKGTVWINNSVLCDSLLGVNSDDTFGLSIYNCVFSDLNTVAIDNWLDFYNCIFYRCQTFIEENDYGRIKNCCFYNPEGYGEQYYSRCGKDGNFWGDPLFFDPDNRDFRIFPSSPCVDAAYSALAPDEDYYGHQRVTLKPDYEGSIPAADIGIYEVTIIDTLGRADLVPVSVIAETNAVPGETVYVEWKMRNNGETDANGSWRDTISLVTKGGREIVLGDKWTSAYIFQGETLFCSASFVVPALDEGTYYPKVNLNSYHDLYEGKLSSNNVFIGKQPVKVVLKESNPNETQTGTIDPGAPAFVKLHFNETDENRMVKLVLPAGVSVSWGFGFMPDESFNSGCAVSEGRALVFLVPEGAVDVYIVLEGDQSASFTCSLIDSNMVITGVFPGILPSSGTATLTIFGGGFGNKNNVTFVHPSENIELGDFSVDACGNLLVTVDCAMLSAGRTYGIKITSEGASAILQNAITVTSVEPFVDLVATLDAPDSVRLVRNTVVYIDYVNKGNVDLPAPIFELSSDGQIFTIDGIKYTNSVKIVGLAKNSPVGMLRPNEPQRLGIAVTIMNDNVKWTLNSYHAGQESAKTTRLSLREFYDDEWVIYHESKDDEQISKLRDLVGTSWSDFYCNFGLWLSFIESNDINFESLKYAFGSYQFLKATGKLKSYEGDNDEQTSQGGKTASNGNENVAPDHPNHYEKWSWGNQEIYKKYGTVWKWCPVCENWVLAVKEENGGLITVEAIDRNADTFVIFHGNACNIAETWIKGIANELSGKGNVLGINWENGRAKYIPDTVTEATAELKKLGINPGKTTFIGHGHGAHVAANIIVKWEKNGGYSFKRFVGLDTSAADKDFTMKPGEWMSSIKSRCLQTEFYKSSYDLSLSEADEMYGHYNFALMREGDFFEWKSGALPLYNLDNYGELSRQAWAHDWFLRTIRNSDEYNDLGFNFAGWETLHRIADPENEINFPKKNDEIFGGLICDKTLEFLSCRKKNGEFRSPWRYEETLLNNQKTLEGKALDKLSQGWNLAAENEIKATIPDKIYHGMWLPVEVYNHADNLSVDYDHLLKAKAAGKDWKNELRTAHGTVRAWLVDLEGIKENIGREPNLGDIYSLRTALIDTDFSSYYYREIGFNVGDFAKPGDNKSEIKLPLSIPNNIFGEDRPLAVKKASGHGIDHYREVALVIASGNVKSIIYLSAFPQWDIYQANNFIIKKVEAHPGDACAVISKTEGGKKDDKTSALSLNALKPGEVVPVAADKDGKWSIALNGAESYVASGGKITASIFELTDPAAPGGEALFQNNSKTCEEKYVTVHGQLSQDTDEDDRLLFEGKKFNVQLTIVSEGKETNTTCCVLDVRAYQNGDSGEYEYKDSSSSSHTSNSNFVSGPIGLGDPDVDRLAKPGDWMTYTVYFENKAKAEASAQEVYVNNPLSAYLDWSTFEMDEIVFGDQVNMGLSGKQSGTSEVTMKGTDYNVRTVLTLDTEHGEAKWYMRIVDPNTETGWPSDILVGFLPPNDETHRGEGHLTYRIKVRQDAPGGVTITNNASIIFDYNRPVKTDPFWWNKVATMKSVSFDGSSTNIEYVVGLPYGELPEPEERKGWVFIGWFTEPYGYGRRITEQSIVEEGDATLYQYWEKSGALAEISCFQAWPFDRRVIINYTLESEDIDENTIFNIKFLGTFDRGLTYFDLSKHGKLTREGDTGTVTGAGKHKTLWIPDESMYDVNVNNMQIKIELKEVVDAFTYMIVDLESGKTSYLDDIPEEGWTNEHKTKKLVLRKIEPGVFTMGSPDTELGRYDNEPQHRVTISQPYYISIFETTQKQYELITGTNPSTFKGDMRPVEQVSYNMVRGDRKGAAWPQNRRVDKYSFLGKLRILTGKTFDLPTEAQWEYACRAGTIKAWNNGTDIINTESDPEMDDLGRYAYNIYDGKGGFSEHTTVGSYVTNAWGLYDMHGNVWEMCLDWYGDYNLVVTDPCGPPEGTYRVIKGGAVDVGASCCRSAFRNSDKRPGYANDYYGFRVVVVPEDGGDDFENDERYVVFDLNDNTLEYFNDPPEGGWTDEHKTTKMVFREIKAGSFTMGSPESELGRHNIEAQHEVTITKPYYIGVFEVTQKQYEMITGYNPSIDKGDARPVESVNYNMIRGEINGSAWPENGSVDEDSFLGKLRSKLKAEFDLPTEAQWEYACRAGTTTSWNNGSNIIDTDQDGELDMLGRYWHNKNDGAGGFNKHTTVGSYLSNAWGLYDMHGNVWEWCLDWYGLYDGDATDPKGAEEGFYRVLRGGSEDNYARDCRAAGRYGNDSSDTDNDVGFRLIFRP